MSSSHPLLDIDYFLYPSLFREIFLIINGLLNQWLNQLQLCLSGDTWNIRFILFTTFQVTSEMLKQGHFLLKFFRILGKCVFLSDILTITASPFHVVEVVTVRIENNFSGVIKKDTCSIIWKVIAETIFRGVVYPFLYPNFSFFGNLLYARAFINLHLPCWLRSHSISSKLFVSSWG